MRDGGTCGWKCRGRSIRWELAHEQDLAHRGRRMMSGGRTIRLGILPEAWLANARERPVEFRRRVIIAIILFVVAQHFLWGILDDIQTPYEPHFSAWVAGFGMLLNFVLNIVLMEYMIENISSTASGGVRIGLRAGFWMFYMLALMISFIVYVQGHSSFGIVMHVMLDSADGTAYSASVPPVADMYIDTITFGTIGALAGAALGYLLAKLADGVKRILKRRSSGQ